MYLCHIIGTDQIHTIIECSNPFSIASIYRNTRDVYSSQQIVSIVGTIVARHLYLSKYTATILYLAAFQHKWSYTGTHPDIMFQIFSYTANTFLDIESCTVLIDNILIGYDFVVIRIVLVDGRQDPVVIDKPHHAFAVDNDFAEFAITSILQLTSVQFHKL